MVPAFPPTPSCSLPLSLIGSEDYEEHHITFEVGYKHVLPAEPTLGVTLKATAGDFHKGML
jgi:hypothetical protein